MTALLRTPGPWAVGRIFTSVVGDYPVRAYPIHGSGTAIASVWAGDPQKAKALRGLEHVGKGNAKLIAAVPDMVDALRIIASYIGGDAAASVARQYARSALTKAGL